MELEVVDLVGKVIIRVSTTSESFLVCIGLGSYLSKIRTRCFSVPKTRMNVKLKKHT